MPPTPRKTDKQAEYAMACATRTAEFWFGKRGNKDPWGHFAAKQRVIATIIRRDAIPVEIDGYSASHGATDGSRGITPVQTGDPNEPGSVVMDGIVGIVDRLVQHGQPRDPIHNVASNLLAALGHMADAADTCDNQLRLVPAIKSDQPEDFWCVSCIRFEVREPRVGRRRHCAWCAAFRAEYGIDPPQALVELHAQGRRITQADILRHVPTQLRKVKATPFSWRDGSTTGITPTPPSAA